MVQLGVEEAAQQALGIDPRLAAVLFATAVAIGAVSQFGDSLRSALAAKPVSHQRSLVTPVQVARGLSNTDQFAALAQNVNLNLDQARQYFVQLEAQTSQAADQERQVEDYLRAAPISGPFGSVADLQQEKGRLDQAVSLGVHAPATEGLWVDQVFGPEMERFQREERERREEAVAGGGQPTIPTPQVPTSLVVPPFIGPTIPPGTLVVPGQGGLSVAGLGAEIAGGLTSALPSALTVALAAAAGTLGRENHLARIACQATTGDRIRQLLGGAVIPMILPFAALRLDVGQGVIAQLGGDLINEFVLPRDLPTPATLEGAPEAAVRLVLRRAGFGLAAHMWAQTMESYAPLKNMGLGQFAGFLGDLAGFRRIAETLTGPVEIAALGRPMTQYANRLYRSTIPLSSELAQLYVRGSLPRTTAEDYMSRQGLSNELVAAEIDVASREARIRELVLVAQMLDPATVPALATPPLPAQEYLARNRERLAVAGLTPETVGADWWVTIKLLRSGYDPFDVPILLATVKRAAVKTEHGQFLSVVQRAYKLGYYTDGQLTELTRQSWDLGDPITAHIKVAQLTRQLEEWEDQRELYLTAMTHGVSTPEETAKDLSALGLSSTRVRLELLRARLGMITKPRLESGATGILASVEA